MQRKCYFFPQVIDEGGRIRRRFTALHQRTRIQKCQLAADALEAGLEVIEKRIEALAGVPTASTAPAERKEAAE